MSASEHAEVVQWGFIGGYFFILCWVICRVIELGDKLKPMPLTKPMRWIYTVSYIDTVAIHSPKGKPTGSTINIEGTERIVGDGIDDAIARFSLLHPTATVTGARS